MFNLYFTSRAILSKPGHRGSGWRLEVVREPHFGPVSLQRDQVADLARGLRLLEVVIVDAEVRAYPVQNRIVVGVAWRRYLRLT